MRHRTKVRGRPLETFTQARLRAGLRVTDLATELEVPASLLEDIESGRPHVRLSEVQRYARALGMEVRLLLEPSAQFAAPEAPEVQPVEPPQPRLQHGGADTAGEESLSPATVFVSTDEHRLPADWPSALQVALPHLLAGASGPDVVQALSTGGFTDPYWAELLTVIAARVLPTLAEGLCAPEALERLTEAETLTADEQYVLARVRGALTETVATAADLEVGPAPEGRCVVRVGNRNRLEQRLAVAAALASHPAQLVLVEADAGLDADWGSFQVRVRTAT